MYILGHKAEIKQNVMDKERKLMILNLGLKHHLSN
jgi:hypothetical protein